MLASSMKTDLLMLDFSGLTKGLVNAKDIVTTISQALRLAGAQLLHLDPREVRCLQPIPGILDQAGFAAVLYDSLAGGAGHVIDLSRNTRGWFEKAVKLLTVEGDVNDEWKEREATRRLLTSEVREFDANFRFKPSKAKEILMHALIHPDAP